MKVIFLDIDGCLNNHHNKGVILDPANINILKHIISTTKAKIVISSAWRYQILEGHMDLRGFTYMLKTHGLDIDIEGITVSDKVLPGRGKQIQLWLSMNKDIENYVVIDDTDDGMPTNHFVMCDANIGLTLLNAERAINILNGPMEPFEKIKMPEIPESERRIILP